MSINSETHVRRITEEVTRSVSLRGIERYLIHASLNDRRLFIGTWSELAADVIEDTALCRAHFLNLTHIGPRSVTRVHPISFATRNLSLLLPVFFAVIINYYSTFLPYNYVYRNTVLIHDLKNFVHCLVRVNLIMEEWMNNFINF
jgi:hypothetical protein